MSPVPGPNDWQGAEIIAIERASSNIVKVSIQPDIYVPFRAGQHIDVRLTAEDGYQASRSYSIASAPGQGQTYDLLIERLLDGEVSGFFHDAAEPGSRMDLKGPVGGHFVWDSPRKGSILLVAGGSGIAPILSMIRHRNLSEKLAPVSLVYAARFAHELVALEELLTASTMDDKFQFRSSCRVKRSGHLTGAMSAFQKLRWPPSWAGPMKCPRLHLSVGQIPSLRLQPSHWSRSACPKRSCASNASATQ